MNIISTDNKKKLNLKILILKLIIIILVSIDSVEAIENKIIYKIDNEIITSIDLKNEIRYLETLNPNIKNLEKTTILGIAKNSILREKIKEIEIKKNRNSFEIDERYLSSLIKDIYSNINLNSEEEFKKYLEQNNLELDYIKQKISIEGLWNELIFFQFSNKVKINKDDLKKELQKNLNSSMKSYNLSEIIFNINNKNEINLIYEKIKIDIESKGFMNAALIHSVSDTSKLGGKLGWIEEKALGKKIKKEILKLKEGDFTKPMIIPGAALILKINEIKEQKIEIDFEKELKNLVKIETNKQLNQYSKLHFNKIKKDLNINEL